MTDIGAGVNREWADGNPILLGLAAPRRGAHMGYGIRPESAELQAGVRESSFCSFFYCAEVLFLMPVRGSAANGAARAARG